MPDPIVSDPKRSAWIGDNGDRRLTTLPQKYFVSADLFATEQREIFGRHWLALGHTSDIAKTGDYFLATVGPDNLIIVRDQRGTINGFYNVCRHRGARLCEAECGRLSAIQCPYHAWTYALDGRLAGAPHMEDVPGFDKAEYPLRRANVGLWEGFIFVNFADHEAGVSDPGYNSLERWFARLGDKFSEWNLPELRSARRVRYDIRANWKLVFQNYSECYHCPGVHPQLQKVSPYDSAENDLSEGPFLGGHMKIHPGTSLTMSGKACAIRITRDPSLSAAMRVAAGEREIEGSQRVFYYSIFPNVLLSLHPDYIMMHQLWPQGPDRTLIVCDWFFHTGAFSRDDFNPEDAIEFWDVTNKQDWHVCELSQQGISSRAYEPGPYSSRESIPAAWDEYYLRVMEQGAVGETDV